ncbi:MAG: hypothetical protein M0R70_05660 [Nitrospirae bacterium]|nr:hypothetical protein [Nitrospirota bacterium]
MYKILIAITALSLVPLTVNAKTETIYASYKYVMGDNDTKNDAKRICFLEAKRLLIVKAGVFIQSETTVSDYKLTKDQITSYTAAIIKVEIANEDIKFNGETQTISMTVKTDIDSDEVYKTLASIQKDKGLQDKIQDQQRQLRELERNLATLQDKLKTQNADEAIVLRKERNVVLHELSESEKIVFTIKATTQKAIDTVEVRMTPSEVAKVAGNPRSTALCAGYVGDCAGWNYGDVWVRFRNGLVQCVLKTSNFDVYNHCSNYPPREVVKK